VYRPTFYLDPATGNVFINGYQLVPSVNGITDPVFAEPVDISAFINGNYPDANNINIYGIPWIIGAKQGLPNFNELYVLNTVQVSRLLQVRRASLSSFNSANYMTNEMFVICISNTVGMSMWNSYNSNYTGLDSNSAAGTPGDIEVYMHEIMRVALTNANNAGSTITNFYYYANLGSWPGSFWSIPNAAAPPPYTGSFLYTNWSQAYLPPSIYQYPGGLFVPVTPPGSLFSPPPSAWQTNVTVNYPFPQMGLMVTNWSQAYILAKSGSVEHIVDYVHFSGPSRTRNLTTELADPRYPDGTGNHYMWSTNAYPASNSGNSPPYGEANQIFVSRGVAGVTAPQGGTWSTAPVDPRVDTLPAAQAAAFGGMFTSTWNYLGSTYVNTNYTMQAPYTPTRTMYDYTLWQANDPLVHYLVSDLNVVSSNGTSVQHSDAYPPTFNITGLWLSQLGLHYQPWGLSKLLFETRGTDTNAINLAYKDPLVVGSDSWNFPAKQTWNPNWLGQIHRGTPWQSVYLKATNIISDFNQLGQSVGLNTWEVWSGATNPVEAQRTSPVSDWHLASLLCAILNTNPATVYFNVNNTNPAAWTVPFDGLTVVTNIATPEASLELSSNSPAVAALAGAILVTQAGEPGGIFGDIGDVFSTPALSTQSPFLNETNPVQEVYGDTITDAAYEALPSQLLGQLGLASLGTVVFTNGQWVAQFTGQTGNQYVLQSSADLIHWTNLVTNSPVLGVMSLPVSAPSGATALFYRSQLLP